ncbi:M57 family metalloprotease [Actinocorallia aurantiaca]|uniref:Peptidase M10 metallopeptidase domain-containing protein n=1 Tax=Actinocorallia aurantiaca TaxID=46204 RepID=A0ABN3UUB4_9ACTN
MADYDWGNTNWLGATYYWVNTVMQDWTVRHHVAWHELGHTLGLRHNYYVGADGTVSCMHTSLDARLLRSGEIGELNAHYP